MLNNKKIAVVVPAYNEETQIGMVIENMPLFVDRIVVINDGSIDNTESIVKEYIRTDKTEAISIGRVCYDTVETIYNRADIVLQEMRKKEEALYPQYVVFNENDHDRIVLINQPNSGNGLAMAVGYKWCRDHNIDCTAVMAGDGQMDPSELESIVSPVVYEGIDYVKGNRLSHPAAKLLIPQIRYFGNSVLSLLNKIASGYWTISDSQTGYTAISLSALERIELFDIYRSYGCPNDLLIKLNIANCSLMEIPIKPVYDVGEKSKMKIKRVIPRVMMILIKGFFKRMWIKYFVNSFHPIFIMYSLGIILGIVNIPVFLRVFIEVIVRNRSVSTGWYFTFLLLTLFSFQSICFGMWMDIQDNEKLCKTYNNHLSGKD